MRRRRARRTGASGYTLVALVVFITVLNIVVAAAMPKWSTAMKRQKEEELIFRGLQYAEAIRLFQIRFGRFPVSLEELIEVNPRCIRQLWKDPMSESGKWGLILIEATQRPGQVGQDDDEEVERDEDESGRTGERSNRRSRRRRPTRSERRAEGPRAGPITGVRSLVDETALITFEGGSKYSQWRFTPDVLALPSAVVGENIPNLNSRWIGRPLPEGAAPAAGGMPNQPGQQPAEQQKPQRSNRNRRRGRDG